MSEPHRIRLRGPWKITAHSTGETHSPATTTTMSIPCTWAEGGWSGLRGRVLHSRSFGKPRQHDQLERIWLVLEAVSGTGEVRLNGRILGSIATESSGEYDITEHLEPRNTLEIELTAPDDQGGVTGEVRLEIR